MPPRRTGRPSSTRGPTSGSPQVMSTRSSTSVTGRRACRTRTRPSSTSRRCSSRLVHPATRSNRHNRSSTAIGWAWRNGPLNSFEPPTVEPVMTTLDENAAGDTTEEFAERMVGAIDAASLAILLSIGHQTKLFDTLADLPPATSAQIADAAGLNERYVREWLGGVAAGRIVDYNPAAQTYSLPGHRAAVLTRSAGPDNLSRVAQFIPLLAEVEQKVIERFHAGGGLSYSEYPRFHTLMAEQSGEVFDAALVDVTLPMADGLPDRLRSGAELADIGC